MAESHLHSAVPHGVVPPREVTQARMDRVFACTTKYKLSQPYSLADRWEERVAQSAAEPFIFFEERTVTFGDMDRGANRIANWALAQGFGQGDVVALMAGNSPEYIMVWLGLAKAGVAGALINPHNRDELLRHALAETGARALIFDPDCGPMVATLGAQPPVSLHQLRGPSGGSAPGLAGAEDLDATLARTSDATPDRSVRAHVRLGDPALYVFTSGTTGRPKAALQSHYKFMIMGETTGTLLELGPGDVYYNVLPLYHGAGGETLVSAAVTFGVPFVLRRKFSTSEFWKDVRRHKVTTLQYIGEVCRYLTNAPPSPDDRDHTLVKMSGAGMRPDVAVQFRDRFGVPRIHETFGGTEFNVGVMNVDGVIGTIGRIPYREKHIGRLVRYDVETGTHPRGPDGFLIECQPGEVGEFVGMILGLPDSGAGWFEGYTSKAATEAKILRNAFREGDAWFRSGDLLRRDEDDYYYFVDRVGDTFRWKSENVSTQEVAEALAAFKGPAMINVYGVKVPGTEGRAGMVALTYDASSGEGPSKFDPAAFYKLAKDSLPFYAVPQFVRLVTESDMTGSFKLRKIDLQREGYDPARTADALYVRSDADNAYVPLTPEALQAAGLPPFAGE